MLQPPYLRSYKLCTARRIVDAVYNHSSISLVARNMRLSCLNHHSHRSREDNVDEYCYPMFFCYFVVYSGESGYLRHTHNPSRKSDWVKKGLNGKQERKEEGWSALDHSRSMQNARSLARNTML